MGPFVCPLFVTGNDSPQVNLGTLGIRQASGKS